MGGTTIGGTTAARWQAAGWAGLAGRSTKYGWIYIKQAQNDNLTSDPPSALLRAGAYRT
jgi:hypothetical protein